jgi:hypothetical protein
MLLLLFLKHKCHLLPHRDTWSVLASSSSGGTLSSSGGLQFRSGSTIVAVVDDFCQGTATLY